MVKQIYGMAIQLLPAFIALFGVYFTISQTVKNHTKQKYNEYKLSQYLVFFELYDAIILNLSWCQAHFYQKASNQNIVSVEKYLADKENLYKAIDNLLIHSMGNSIFLNHDSVEILKNTFMTGRSLMESLHEFFSANINSLSPERADAISQELHQKLQEIDRYRKLLKIAMEKDLRLNPLSKWQRVTYSFKKIIKKIMTLGFKR